MNEKQFIELTTTANEMLKVISEKLDRLSDNLGKSNYNSNPVFYTSSLTEKDIEADKKFIGA